MRGIKKIFFIAIAFFVINTFNAEGLHFFNNVVFNYNHKFVDYSFLSKKYNFSMSLPLSFGRITRKAQIDIKKKVNKAIKPFFIFSLYLNKNNMSSCIISLYTPEKDIDINAFYLKFNKSIMDKFKSEKVTFSPFIKGNIRILQYFVVGKNKVTIKLFFKSQKKTFVEIDFVILKQFYNMESKYIESSIASIKKVI